MLSRSEVRSLARVTLANFGLVLLVSLFSVIPQGTRFSIRSDSGFLATPRPCGQRPGMSKERAVLEAGARRTGDAGHGRSMSPSPFVHEQADLPRSGSAHRISIAFSSE